MDNNNNKIQERSQLKQCVTNLYNNLYNSVQVLCEGKDKFVHAWTAFSSKTRT